MQQHAHQGANYFWNPVNKCLEIRPEISEIRSEIPVFRKVPALPENPVNHEIRSEIPYVRRKSLKSLIFDVKFLEYGLKFLKFDLKSLISGLKSMNLDLNALKSGLEPLEHFIYLKPLKS